MKKQMANDNPELVIGAMNDQLSEQAIISKRSKECKVENWLKYEK